MTRGRAAAVASAALLAVGGGVALMRAREGVRDPAPIAAPAPAVPEQSTPEPDSLPGSLRGTHTTGELRVDAHGRFVAGPEAIALFDYYLAATGEEPPERIRARIVAEIRSRLAPENARDAEALLERYLGYRAAAAELFAASDLALAEPERRFQRIRELRREWFGAELSAALFGREERTISVELERQRVAADPRLDPAERARRLAELDQQLPESERAARKEALAAVELRAEEAALREAGAGSNEIDALRERRVGPEASARLSELDRRREQWNARVAAYRAEREALRSQSPTPDDYHAALAKLREAHFSGPERARIEALDRIETEQPSR